MELVNSAHLWWRKYSTLFFVILGALPAINLYLPFAEPFLPPKTFAIVTAIVGILGVVATQVKQPKIAAALAEEQKTIG